MVDAANHRVRRSHASHHERIEANNGILVSRDAKTGELLIDQTRLPNVSTVYASPVAAAGHIFLTGRDGTTLVLKHGKSFELVATNKLDGEIDASAAIVDDEIFLRSKTHLYCIAKYSPSVSHIQDSFQSRTVATWRDEEVARRWLMLCPHRRGADGSALPPSEPEIKSIAGCPVDIVFGSFCMICL